MQCLLEWGTSRQPRHNHIWIRGGEPINQPGIEKKPQNGRLNERLLLTVTVADPKQFILESELVTYIGVFVELYYWRNHEQIHELHGMMELGKMHALTAENPRNLGAYQIIVISSLLHSTHIVPRNQEKFIFYLNNHIDQDQFNRLYDSDWMKKGK